MRSSFVEYGLTDAIQRHDDDAIYDWLVEAISFQGISDGIAAGYIEQHGSAEAADIRASLNKRQGCAKLNGYWVFEECGYRKTAGTCNEPALLQRCPLPRLNLRNGSLNQAAFSIFMFMRDVAGGDFVSWLDRRLGNADSGHGLERAKGLRDAVIQPQRYVHGLSL